MEKPITCDFKNCLEPAVVLILNRNFCTIHQYEY